MKIFQKLINLIKKIFLFFNEENFEITEGNQFESKSSTLHRAIRGSEENTQIKIEREGDKKTSKSSLEDLSPKILIRMTDKRVEMNSKVEFACEYYSKTEITSIKWFHNGIEMAMRSNRHIIRIEEYRSYLIIFNVAREDIGSYEIRIENKCGIVKHSANLIILRGMQFTLT